MFAKIFRNVVSLFVCLSINYAYPQTNLSEIKGALYATVKEFIANEPSFVVPKKSGNYFKVNIANDKVSLKKDNTTKEYAPGSIYGYFDGRNKYRYYKTDNPLHTGYFKIVELGQIIIYEKLVYYVSKPIAFGSKGHRGLVREVFYSLTLDSPIKELNHNNLINDFKDNPVALAEINAVNNSCKSCLSKQKADGYFVNTTLNELAKKHPDKFKQQPINGDTPLVPIEKREKEKGKGKTIRGKI